MSLQNKYYTSQTWAKMLKFVLMRVFVEVFVFGVLHISVS